MPPPTPTPPTNALPHASEVGGATLSLAIPPTPGEAAVLSIFDMEGAGLALSLNSFTQVELVTKLVTLARDVDPKIQQRALAQLTSYLKDVATINGRITKATIQKETTNAEDGTTLKQTSSRLGILSQPRPNASTLSSREFIQPSSALAPPLLPEPAPQPEPLPTSLPSILPRNPTPDLG